ncbi:MAG TPA: pyruvate kinase [Isosphaeraceae bacterium]|jgi:pyruvate kinase|nr:pyruvate kinase [Isosphaeraceae bacterium]
MSNSQIAPPAKVRTKIVATVGPASREPSVLRALVAAGAEVFRLNFSHGTHEEHSEVLQAIRTIGQEEGRALGVLQDLGGPKIRLGDIPGDEVECRLGDRFTLVSDRTSDDPHQLTCTYRDLPRDLKPGDVVLFADGAVAMAATQSDGACAQLTVTLAGRLRSHQGLNLPGVALNIKALTDKDLHDLDWTAQHCVEYVGQSFVRCAEDVAWLRRELTARGCRARIVAKIEKPEAVDELDAILHEADAVMVARGDLGVEMDVARVPAVQKRVIAACHRERVPVITATQMLNSMEHSSRPTRAEASDVFNAVLDGTDAVMLSGETAIGDYPVEAVATMSRIAAEAEAVLFSSTGTPGCAQAPEAAISHGRAGWITPITEGVVEAASLVGRRLKAALVIVATQSGRTALALSKQRQAAPIVALSSDAEIVRSMALYWGVSPLHFAEIADIEHALSVTLDWARTRGLIHGGDRVVLVRGTIPGNPAHNAMLVQEVE